MQKIDKNPYGMNSSFLLKLLENLPSHVFWKNKEGVYLGCNSAFARSLGLEKPEDVIGKSDYDLPVQKESSDAYRNDDQEVMASRRPKLNIEEKQIFRDGREVFLLTSKVPLFDSVNEVLGILGIYSDITELKNTQEALLKATSLSKAKSLFIANMSHDIRTPIAGIVGMVESLLSTAHTTEVALTDNAIAPSEELLAMTHNLASRVKNDCHILMGSVHQLLQLCNEILEAARLESGASNELPESFDIRELVQHNIELLQPVAQDKKLNLRAVINSNVPHYLKGLRGYVDRILLNLISNALKFTNTGHVSLKVLLLGEETASYKKEDKVTVQLIVEDTGIGIPEDKFEVIFENFSRLTPSYEGVYKGSGLGLYTIKRYVEALKGNIALASKVGQGTCFKITLPLTVSDKAHESHQLATSLKPSVTSSSPAEHSLALLDRVAQKT